MSKHRPPPRSWGAQLPKQWHELPEWSGLAPVAAPAEPVPESNRRSGFDAAMREMEIRASVKRRDRQAYDPFARNA